MWKEADRAATHALTLGAREFGGMTTLLISCLNGTSDIQEARRIMSTFSSDSRISSRSFSADVVDIIGQRAYLSVIERDFRTAPKIWEVINDPSAKSELGVAARPAIHVLAGDAASTQPESERARERLEETLR